MSITALKVNPDDEWLTDYIRDNGDGVENSPHFKYLKGKSKDLHLWMSKRSLPWDYVSKPLMDTLVSLIKEGQKEPIKIYKDMKINTGHKRAACMLFLGFDKIKAVVVPDDYKL